MKYLATGSFAIFALCFLGCTAQCSAAAVKVHKTSIEVAKPATRPQPPSELQHRWYPAAMPTMKAAVSFMQEKAAIATEQLTELLVGVAYTQDLFLAMFLAMVVPYILLDVYSTVKDHYLVATTEEVEHHQRFPWTRQLLKMKDSQGRNTWEQKVVDEKTRMEINGESKEQMDHARYVKEYGQKDTSEDQEWEVDESLAFNDTYVLVTSGIWIILKFIIFAIPLVIVAFPYMCCIWLYTHTFKAGTDVVKRNTVQFILIMELFCKALFFIPYLLMQMVLFCDYIFYYLFSLTFLVLFRKDGWTGYCKSRVAIGPYVNGPQHRLTDVMVCHLGQVARNGVVECTKCLAGTALLLPWLKYYVNANPFIYPLEERFVQQISTSMEDCGLEDATDTARRIISRSYQGEDLRHMEHMWDFIPHYPYPPPGRRWATGIQHVGKFFQLWVHPTHAHAEAKGSMEQFVLSNCVEIPVYRVMLWYNNPYHFFTGFVEASISTGGLSQPNKKYGGEHPMWLITSRSPLLTSRDSRTGVGMIDAFFDYWLPDFVDAVRAVLKGPEEAKRLHQEVISKDKVSPPSQRRGSEAGSTAALKIEAMHSKMDKVEHHPQFDNIGAPADRSPKKQDSAA